MRDGLPGEFQFGTADPDALDSFFVTAPPGGAGTDAPVSLQLVSELQQGLVVVGIIFVSILPMIWGYFKTRRDARA